MTRRSITSFNTQLRANYMKGWNDAYTQLWNDLQRPEGVPMKDGRIARAVIEPAPKEPEAAGIPATNAV